MKSDRDGAYRSAAARVVVLAVIGAVFALVGCEMDSDSEGPANLVVTFDGSVLTNGTTVDLGSLTDPGPAGFEEISFDIVLTNRGDEEWSPGGFQLSHSNQVTSLAGESLFTFGTGDASGIDSPSGIGSEDRNDVLRFTKSANDIVPAGTLSEVVTIASASETDFTFTVSLNLVSNGSGRVVLRSLQEVTTALNNSAVYYVLIRDDGRSVTGGATFSGVDSTLSVTGSNQTTTGDGSYRLFIFEEEGSVDNVFDSATEQIIGPIDFTVEGDTIVETSELVATDAYQPTVVVPDSAAGTVAVTFLAPGAVAPTDATTAIQVSTFGSLTGAGGTATTSVWISTNGLEPPPGEYDLYFWVDVDSDNTVNTGDLTYRENGYSITADDVAGNEVLDFSTIVWQTES